MSNQADHTIVRLRVPPELKEKIEKSAEEKNRSQSAEMVSRLEESFNETSKHPDVIVELAKELSNKTNQITEKIKDQEKAYLQLENFYKQHIASIQNIEALKEESYKSHIKSLEGIIKDLQDLLKNQEK